ncbi:MAG: hypothetical protein Ta2A_00450 [Treponemataceae bacterium]|nr:MAG: hypothetical protein Ta2A_00450 [Treponemataceae bacterium]
MCMLTVSLAASAQDVTGLAQLDTAAESAATQIKPTLQGLPAGARIKIADFHLNDAETDLERYWRMQLAGLLAENAKYTILCTEIESDAPSDYVLRGNMLQTNSELRIYTRLIRVEGSAIIKSWTIDLARSDFLDEMTQIASGSRSNVRRDRYEIDSRTNPVPFRLSPDGTDIARTFHDSQDQDWFSITPETAGILIVETAGDLDTYMFLYEGTSEDEIATNDDGGTGDNAKIERNVKAGVTYIVRVKDLQNRTGNYSFGARLNPLPVDTAEPNDSRESATLLKVSDRSDGRVDGVFGKENDIDWYKIEIPAGGRVLSLASSGSVKEMIEVYVGDDVLVEKSDCDCDNIIHLNVKVPAGTTFVKMTAQGGEIGTYTLTAMLRALPPSDAFEDDDRKSLAKPIELNVAQAHTFSDSDDVDWIKFTVSERGIYDVAVSNTRGGLDSYMELYDSDENYIDDDDDSGGSYNPVIRSRLEAGTYYVKIRCLDSDPLEDNRYTVKVSLFAQ